MVVVTVKARCRGEREGDGSSRRVGAWTCFPGLPRLQTGSKTTPSDSPRRYESRDTPCFFSCGIEPWGKFKPSVTWPIARGVVEDAICITVSINLEIHEVH